MSARKPTDLLISIGVGIISLLLFLSNATHSLGFADAAEFALTTFLAGIAHPPGFPAYVLSGYLWCAVVDPFTHDHTWSLILFSAFCSALTALLLYHITNTLLGKFSLPTITGRMISVCTALAWSAGATVWYWSNSVEVYALQGLATVLSLYGIIQYRNHSNKTSLFICGIGIAIGLSNHHLTMILMLPFLTALLYPEVQQKELKPVKQKKKTVAKHENRIKLFPIPRPLLITALTAFAVTLFFYGWMFIRAQQQFVFEFGNPDNLSRFIYHLSGGAWIKNTAREVTGIAAMRFPYFMQLIWHQFTFLLPLLILGIGYGIYKLRSRLAGAAFLYFLIVLAYQLRIDQTSDTDAYLLPAFTLLAPFVAFGAVALINTWKPLVWLLPVLLVILVAQNYERTDKKDYNVSASLMQMLDQSAPKGAVILISDWTLSIQYHYFRIAENFRPDLTVLNYDLKFTNYESVKKMYPELYTGIQKEYDKFVQLLGSVHPQEIYNTGCTLNTLELMDAYRQVVFAIQRYCKQKNVAYMVDPKAFVFQLQNGMMTSSSKVSGCLVTETETGLGKSFLELPFAWLQSPLTLSEPAATDKLVDFEAMLDFHRNYYKSSGDTVNYLKAESSYQEIKALQRKVKKHIPFVFRKK